MTVHPCPPHTAAPSGISHRDLSRLRHDLCDYQAALRLTHEVLAQQGDRLPESQLHRLQQAIS